MPRVNRGEIFADDEIQVFHLVNRCVRRTYLCGRDEETGRDYSHRKQWIRDRLEVLAGIFAVDVLSFAIMSNHLHVVARTRPDLVKAWSDEEVALRWLSGGGTFFLSDGGRIDLLKNRPNSNSIRFAKTHRA